MVVTHEIKKSKMDKNMELTCEVYETLEKSKSFLKTNDWVGRAQECYFTTTN